MLASCYPVSENTAKQKSPSHPKKPPPLPTPRHSRRRKRPKKGTGNLAQEKATENPATPRPRPAKNQAAGGAKRDYAFANKVPGKEGFVFSPYNNKVVDVRDIPSGTLVQDPTYPAAEKKYFRVP